MAAGLEAGGVEYRPAMPSASDFARLFATTGWLPAGRPSPGELERSLRASLYAVSAYVEGSLVGTGRVVGDGVLHGLIADVIVDPSWQGRGIGSEIVRRLIVECRRRGIVDVQLFAAAGKRRFYERLGFAARPDEAPGMELLGTAGVAGQGSDVRSGVSSRRVRTRGRRRPS